MIHILFGDYPAGSLRVALKELGKYKLEQIISFRDMFSIGPVRKLHEKSGQEARLKWTKIALNDENDDFPDFQQKFYKAINQIYSIPKDVPITLWVADNAHEQTGLRYVLHLLKNKTNDIKVVNTTKMYAEHCKRPNIEYTVLQSGELSPEKLQVIYEQSKLTSTLSTLKRKQLEEEWLALAESQETLRIWSKGRIKSVKEDHYDQYMIKMAKKLQAEREHEHEPGDFMKSARLIGEVLGHLDQYVGDEFLEYRLRKLIEKGDFEMEGSLKAMRFYSVRLKRGFL
ncbi:DUF1835 domain-containing protein [Cytobacillus depressus]|uniref:DUF1835 domain-containing protein n=2 Tax=Cytobacillus depressus TaxID=1602942 RepID=A0A6L3VAF3_9BACI|nr:DUF1835 domain-containing protein [Cytobacillus depressus]